MDDTVDPDDTLTYHGLCTIPRTRVPCGALTPSELPNSRQEKYPRLSREPQPRPAWIARRAQENSFNTGCQFNTFFAGVAS
jgi:hypothetical protein